jgi:hypothetical protein
MASYCRISIFITADETLSCLAFVTSGFFQVIAITLFIPAERDVMTIVQIFLMRYSAKNALVLLVGYLHRFLDVCLDPLGKTADILS